MTELASQTLTTDRLETHVWVAGSPEHPPVLLIHGNVSSAVFFDRLQAELARSRYVIAPDLRGYGGSQTKPVDATRGVRDYADDLAELLNHGSKILHEMPDNVNSTESEENNCRLQWNAEIRMRSDFGQTILVGF